VSHPKQFILDIADELVVDLFAGGGGASCGIEQALGRHVDIAVNHDPEAVALHQANHPQTRHFVSDVFEVDPRFVTSGRRIGLLWASPDCTFHSKARGGKPFRDRNKARRRRGLATVVTKWVRLLKPTQQHPRLILLENVEEFQHWGPLLEDGTPCPDRRGTSFQRWVAELKNLGYQVDWRELRACDFGAPTIRKRLFLIARCDGLPITWPQPTHADPKHAKAKGLLPWRTAAECIDWSMPCPSIFDRERPLADATLRRVARGVMRYVVEAAKPFIVHIAHGDGKPGGVQRWGSGTHDIGKPLPTVTTKAEHMLAVPTLVQTGYGERPGQAPRVPGLDKPLGTVVGGQKHGLVAAFLAKHYGGVTGHGVEQPLGTVTTSDHHSLVAAAIAPLRGTSPAHKSAHSVEAPLSTVSAGGTHHALVGAFLSAYYGSDQDTPVDQPLHTITTKPRFALVMVNGEPHAIVDIGMRMLQPRELYRAQGFPDTYIIECGADGRHLSKAAQVRMCGNSVSPVMSHALARANFVEHHALRAAA
jgi:DNA (cytosine-5)-methyltransferase 1